MSENCADLSLAYFERVSYIDIWLSLIGSLYYFFWLILLNFQDRIVPIVTTFGSCSFTTDIGLSQVFRFELDT